MDENEPCAMCYTSGTTGQPKGVVYSHRSQILHSLVQALPDAIGIGGSDVILPVVPMFHANAWGVPYTAAMLGVKMVFPGPHLHPDDLLPLLESEQVTISCGVPTIWLPMVQILEKNPGRWKFHPWLRLTVGGSAVPEAMIRAYARLGIQIIQGWGMTETSPLATDLQDHRAARASVRGGALFRCWPSRAIRCRWWTCAPSATRARRPGTARRWARSRCAARGSRAAITISRQSENFTRGRLVAHRRRGVDRSRWAS